eukprot:SM000028S10169  [mRNA]  locus=s28:718282:721366:- [translate_table: standard]
MADSTEAPLVSSEVSSNGLGVITLNRPKALNAMNLDMDVNFKRILDDWQSTSSVKVILIKSSTSRAFSSGMDVKWCTAAIRQEPTTELVQQVFTAEYTLICAIARCRKPYVSFMDGVTMGFGLGIACHGHVRIVTERTILAMPENSIGLFPDVGYAYLAATVCKPGIGSYLALTGARLSNPADALYSGLATHYVPSEKLKSLQDALETEDLSTVEEVHSIIRRFQQTPEDKSTLEQRLDLIERCFGDNKTVADIVRSLQLLERSNNPEEAAWAHQCLQDLAKGAPFSLAATQRHLAACTSSNPPPQIEEVMQVEYRLATRISTRPDFVEGVRAALIDKDQKPKWQPASLDDVEAADLEAVFAPLQDPCAELHF